MGAASSQLPNWERPPAGATSLSLWGPDGVGCGSHCAHGALRLESCVMVQMRCFDPFGGGRSRGNMALFGRQGVNSPVMTLWLRFLRYDRPPGHQRCFSSRCMRPGVRTAEKVRIGARFTFWPEKLMAVRNSPFPNLTGKRAHFRVLL